MRSNSRQNAHYVKYESISGVLRHVFSEVTLVFLWGETRSGPRWSEGQRFFPSLGSARGPTGSERGHRGSIGGACCVDLSSWQVGLYIALVNGRVLLEITEFSALLLLAEVPARRVVRVRHLRGAHPWLYIRRDVGPGQEDVERRADEDARILAALQLVCRGVRIQ